MSRTGFFRKRANAPAFLLALCLALPNIYLTVSAAPLITNLAVNDTANAAGWSVQQNFQAGVTPLLTDSKTIQAPIPPYLLGQEWIQTAKNSKTAVGTGDMATFAVAADCDVYIAASFRNPVYAWLAAGGWAAVSGDTLNDGGQTFNLYKQSFAAGSTVHLGYAQGSSSDNMYFVIAVPAGATPDTPGDAVAAVTAPVGTVMAVPLVISGTMSDPVNNSYITAVKVAVQDLSGGAANGNYLNGGAFTETAPYFQNAAFNSAAGTWSLSLANVVFAPGGAYGVTVYACDSGNGAPVSSSFTVDQSVVVKNSALVDTSGVFDLKSGAANNADLNIGMALNGNTLASVVSSAGALASGADYAVNGSAVTIYKTWLQKQAAGVQTLTFKFSAGIDSTYALTVLDSSQLVSGLKNYDGQQAWLYQTNLQNGVSVVYSDRAYKYYSLSGIFRGASYIQTANGSKVSATNPIATFMLGRPADIYLGWVPSIKTPAPWLAADGWTLTPYTGVNDNNITSPTCSYVFYVKHFDAGPVSLKPNTGGTSSDSMYSLVIMSNVPGNAAVTYGGPKGSVAAYVNALTGTAADPDGDSFIQAVNITVQNASTGQYLNAATGAYSAAPVLNPAAYDISTLGWTLDMSKVTLAPATYNVTAVANDGADGAPAAGSFTIAANIPGDAVSTVTGPTGGSIEIPQVVRGTAADPLNNMYVNYVSVAIKRDATGMYYNSAAKLFDSSAPLYDKAGYDPVSAAWSYPIQGADIQYGSYTITTYANDGADGTVSSASFSLSANTFGDAAAAITQPADGYIINNMMLDNTPVIISGTASDPVDNQFLIGVKVAVMNSSGQYLHTDSGRFADGQYLINTSFSLTDYTWNLDLSAYYFKNDTYTITAYANDGVLGTPAQSTFKMYRPDNMSGNAVCTLVSPSGTVSAAPVVIIGTAYDPDGNQYIQQGAIYVSIMNGYGKYLNPNTNAFDSAIDISYYLTNVAVYDPVSEIWSFDVSGVKFDNDLYTVKVKVKDWAAGNDQNPVCTGSFAVNAPTGGPLPPRNVMMPPAANTDTTIDIMWDKPADTAGVTGYNVYVNGSVYAATTKGNVKLTGLAPGTAYSVYATARNAAGAESIISNTITVSTKPTGQVFNITAYGAVGDGATLNTAAIQSAINACTPGGVVEVPAGTFVTGALFLKSDMTLLLDANSVLKGYANPSWTTQAQIAAQYPLIKSSYEGARRDTIYASIITVDGNLDHFKTNPGEIHDVTICGQGTIDAQGSVLSNLETSATSRSDRSNTITMINCNNVYIQGITINNSPTWTIHPIYSKNISTEGIFENTQTDPVTGQNYNVGNADGWDPDASVNCYLYNATLRTHDDNVAIKSGSVNTGMPINGVNTYQPTVNVRITDCNFPSGGGIAIGSENSNGIEGIFIQDVIMGNTDRGIQIKSQRGRGGYTRDVFVDNVTVTSAGSFGIALNLQYSGPITGYQAPGIGTPYFSNFVIQNYTVNNCTSAIQMPGLPESYIKDVLFKNVTINATSGLTAQYVSGVTFDNVTINVKSGPLSVFANCDDINGYINGTSGSAYKSPIITNLKVYDIINSSNWTVTPNIQAGNVFYNDQPTYVISQLPAGLAGCDWIRTANASGLYPGEIAGFVMGTRGDVYVAYPNSIGVKPSWMDSSWTDTGLSLNGYIPELVKGFSFKVYKKSFAQGAAVSLGSNEGNANNNMYIVMAKATTAANYTVTFNYNDNGATPDSRAAVTEGAAAPKPSPDPDRAGYTFTGWYTDAAATAPYNWGSPVTGDLTLYAGWSNAPVPPTSITMSAAQTSLNMKVGTKLSLKITVSPENADPNVTWSSSNPAVATVDPVTGQVTALKTGSVRITVKSNLNPAASYMFLVMINA